MATLTNLISLRWHIAVLCHILKCRNVTQETNVDYLLVFQYWVWRATHHFPEFIISLHGKANKTLKTSRYQKSVKRKTTALTTIHPSLTKSLSSLRPMQKLLFPCSHSALCSSDFLLFFFPHRSSVSFFTLEINAAGNVSFLLTATQADQMKCRDR